jgi:serine/threonine protein kinase
MLRVMKFGEWVQTGDEPVGTGGNGQVWAVRRASDGSCGALKLLLPFADPSKTAKRSRRFAREVRAMQELCADGVPGLIPVIDASGLNDAAPWFVMPLAQPLTLPHGANTTETLDWAVKAMIQVSETVAALHLAQHVHRDIKPANLLIWEGRVVLGDLGLTRSLDDDHLTVTGEQTGSAGYRAPESIGRSEGLEFGSDVYGLAKTTWALISGERPPDGVGLGSDPSLALTKRFNVEIPNLAALDDLLDAATRQRAGDRPSVADFRNGLIAFLRPLSLSESSPTGGALARAQRLFADEAARNSAAKRRTDQVQMIVDAAHRTFGSAVGPFVTNLGWSKFATAGGHSPPIEQWATIEGWNVVRPNWLSGSFCGQTLTWSLLILHKEEPDGGHIFRAGHLLWIYGADRQFENFVADQSWRTFLEGPDYERVKNEIVVHVGSEGTLHRAIQAIDSFKTT